MPDVVTLYMTTPDADAAEKIAGVLLDERLIACANILSGATSLYRWEGKLCRDAEAVTFMKTTADRAEAAIARAVELHPYDVPAIVALKVAAAHPAYADWVGAEVSPDPAG